MIRSLIFSLVFVALTTQANVNSEMIKQYQEDLAWLGFYNGLADGVSGPRTRSALEDFQYAYGGHRTGVLTPEQEFSLKLHGSQARAAVGWTEFIHPDLGYSLSYPSLLLSKAVQLDNGGRYFFGPDFPTGLKIRIMPERETLESIFYRIKSQYSNNFGSVSYDRLSTNWFVVKAQLGSNAVYIRHQKILGGFIALEFNYAAKDITRLEPLVVAIAQSLEVPANLSWFSASELKEATPKVASSTLIANDSQTQQNSKKTERKRIAETDNRSADEMKRGRKQLSATELFRRNSKTVYTVIAVNSEDDENGSQGSAVAITENIALTNCHVVEGKRHLILYNGDNFFPASSITLNQKNDMCILITDGKFGESVVPNIRRYDSLDVGEDVYAIGSPSGLDLTLSKGLVSGKRIEGDQQLVQTSAAISPGSSGGALFDDSGWLLGITTFGLIDAQNLNFAIAAEDYIEAIRRDMEK